MTIQAICLHLHISTYSISQSDHQQVNHFTAKSCQSLSFQQAHEKPVSNTSHLTFSSDQEKTKLRSTPLNTTCTPFAGLSLHFLGPSLLLCSSGTEKPARRISRWLQTETYFPLQASKLLHPSWGMNSTTEQRKWACCYFSQEALPIPTIPGWKNSIQTTKS